MADQSRAPKLAGRKRGLSRRELIGAGVLTAGGWALAGGSVWWRRNERGKRADVFIGAAVDYNADLLALVEAGLKTLNISRDQIRGKSVLLKPNLVETAVGQRHINTHPALVVAAAEAFRRLDAREVLVAEGQGHNRDSLLVLDESGMGAAIRAAGLRFVDLNHDDVQATDNAGGWTKLGQLHLPRTLRAADLVVSMPKLKTHHWAGVTCAMKNLFGVMPGIVYGWPKNVLHWAGIANSILDINATVRPALAIVDGIVGMEGDGPIMGTPKPLGCVVIGADLPAVDATCVRLMDLDPAGVEYLSGASGRLGATREANIRQRGERIERFRTRFSVLELPHLKRLRKPAT